MTSKHENLDCEVLPRAHRLGGMARPRSNRVAITFRVSPEAAARIKTWLRDNAGRPLYARPGPWAEVALLREIERQDLILTGALPPDGGDPVKGRKAVIDNARKRTSQSRGDIACTTRSR